MSESMIGRKIRLTGTAWSAPGDAYGHVPHKGEVYEVLEERHGFPVVYSDEPGDMGWAVMFGSARWGGEWVHEKTVSEQGLGYLDGWLGLPASSMSDEYLLGYGHGSAVRERRGED